MKRWGVLVLIVGLFISSTALKSAAKEIDLIDCPTADVLAKREYRIVTRVFPEDGLLLKTQLGLLDRVTIGIFYGGIDVISNVVPQWYPGLNFMIRYRLMDEDISFPALAVGFDSQGYGSYSGLHKRYDYKAKGIYGVASKAFAQLMGLRVHVGVNYNSFEGDSGENTKDYENDDDDGVDQDEDDDEEEQNKKRPNKYRNGNGEDEDNDDRQSLNGYVGLDFPFNPQMIGIVEYDIANNDNRRDNLYGNGHGYLNAAIRWQINPKFTGEVGFKDILETAGQVGRYISLDYENNF